VVKLQGMKGFRIRTVFACTVFLGSFLLFQIQPLIGKYLLPWFGGAPSVWLTCLMFFQLLLLGGYAYAHVVQRLAPSRQAFLHAGLLATALVAGGVLVSVWGSPLLPGLSWRPEGTERPVFHILRLLLVSIGLSYFLLSSGASLLQIWFHRVQPDRSPYIFYIVSNTASLLALLSYPLLFEPLLTTRQQAWLWSGGFTVYVMLCSVCAANVRKTPAIPHDSDSPNPLRPPYSKLTLWTLISFCSVLSLMAMTNRMTLDIPPVPFLWILPLSIYLLSYILGFMEKQRNWQDGYIYLLICAFGAVWYLSGLGLEIDIRTQIAVYSFILLAICIFCHNALYRTKPAPANLTGFYLCISLGGALGGLFAVLAAPFLFKGYWEYELALILTGSLALFFIYTDPDTRRTFQPIRHAFPVLLVLFSSLLIRDIAKETKNSVYMGRNFFGSVRVAVEINNNIPIYSLLHGKINHGMQIDHPAFRTRPTTYFTENSGVGLALQFKQHQAGSMRVGVLGLGIGTLAAYGREGDVYRMYEIDADIIRLAEEAPYFSYLRDSKAAIRVVEGDGRLSLERELLSGGPERFDLLVLDAFSGDSPPAHLLTLEAFDLYLKHLAEEGVIAVNISNRYLDLLPVLVQVSRHFTLNMAYIQSRGDMKISAAAQWVLLSREDALIRYPAVSRVNSLGEQAVREIRPWTDDYSNLLRVMK